MQEVQGPAARTENGGLLPDQGDQLEDYWKIIGRSVLEPDQAVLHCHPYELD